MVPGLGPSASCAIAAAPSRAAVAVRTTTPEREGRPSSPTTHAGTQPALTTAARSRCWFPGSSRSAPENSSALVAPRAAATGQRDLGDGSKERAMRSSLSTKTAAAAHPTPSAARTARDRRRRTAHHPFPASARTRAAHRSALDKPKVSNPVVAWMQPAEHGAWLTPTAVHEHRWALSPMDRGHRSMLLLALEEGPGSCDVGSRSSPRAGPPPAGSWAEARPDHVPPHGR